MIKLLYIFCLSRKGKKIYCFFERFWACLTDTWRGEGESTVTDDTWRERERERWSGRVGVGNNRKETCGVPRSEVRERERRKRKCKQIK